ncbi:MAG: hypothetical protein GXY38_13570 [Planctomycetes bacterium]|jgi:hypothetical protein|nr:hypothetical protein [Planctomycetota bacterium]
MKRWAFNIAGVSFFILAAICWAGDLDPLTCAIRSLSGAGAIYVIVLIASKLAINMIVSDVMRQSRGHEVKDQEH